MQKFFQKINSLTYNKKLAPVILNYDFSTGINKTTKIDSSSSKRELRSILLSICAFLIFFISTIFTIRYLIFISKFLSKNHPDYMEFYHLFIYIIPLLGGTLIAICNHKYRYTKPFNDGILFLSSALTAYFLLDKNIPFKGQIGNIVKIVFGPDYQYTTSLFLATCLIGKTLIAFAEFLYEQKKHVLKNFS
ncbi:TPA: hypothetical protein ACNIC5_005503 [Klebsiella pneumoniae]